MGTPYLRVRFQCGAIIKNCISNFLITTMLPTGIAKVLLAIVFPPIILWDLVYSANIRCTSWLAGWLWLYGRKHSFTCVRLKSCKRQVLNFIDVV